MQWNLPNRTDNYLMQVGVEVRRCQGMLSKKAPKVTMKQMQLKFGQAKVGKQKPTDSVTHPEGQLSAYEEMVSVAKRNRLLRGMGVQPRVMFRDGNGGLREPTEEELESLGAMGRRAKEPGKRSVKRPAPKQQKKPTRPASTPAAKHNRPTGRKP